METLVAWLALHGRFPQPGRLGPQHHQRNGAIPADGGHCGWSVKICRRRPIEITLDPVAKDTYGLPVASVHYDDHPNDVAMRDHAYKQGSAVLRGDWRHSDLSNAALSQHPQSRTNRMSEKAKDGVVNKFGQTHDIKNLFVSDGSQFTSSAACNPTLTIVSLAIRQADQHRRRDAAKRDMIESKMQTALFRKRTEPHLFVAIRTWKDHSAASRTGAGAPRNAAGAATFWIDRSGRSIATARRNAYLAMVIEHFVCSLVRNFPSVMFSFAAISSSVSQNDISRRIEVQWPPIRKLRVCDRNPAAAGAQTDGT